MDFKILSEIADVKFCAVSASRGREQNITAKWLAYPNFMADNVINLDFSEGNNIPSEECRINCGDIVVKRISPTYINYIDDIPQGVYAGNNIIIITIKNDNVYPKYLAMILNERIENLSNSTSIGSVLKSINRVELEQLEIPIPNLKNQILIGNIWYQTIELKKMKSKLAQLEAEKNNYMIKKYIDTFGGNGNGKNNI